MDAFGLGFWIELSSAVDEFAPGCVTTNMGKTIAMKAPKEIGQKMQYTKLTKRQVSKRYLNENTLDAYAHKFHWTTLGGEAGKRVVDALDTWPSSGEGEFFITIAAMIAQKFVVKAKVEGARRTAIILYRILAALS